MKKFFVPLLILFFTNCGDEDDNGMLVGIWVATSQTITECADGNSSSADLDCSDFNCFELNLMSDNTYAFQQGSFQEAGTWENNEVLALCQDQEGEELCVEYTVEQNTTLTLILSRVNQGTSCKTTLFFERQAAVDTTGSN